jgi:hypothetical protein
MVAELVKVLDRDRWSAERAETPTSVETGRLLSR